MANWRPNGNRPVAPAPGWGGNHRPGVGGGNAGLAHRVPSNGGNGMRPGTSTGRPATNNHRPGVTGNHVDLCVLDHQQAEAFGVQTADVWVVAE